VRSKEHRAYSKGHRVKSGIQTWNSGILKLKIHNTTHSFESEIRNILTPCPMLHVLCPYKVAQQARRISFPVTDR